MKKAHKNPTQWKAPSSRKLRCTFRTTTTKTRRARSWEETVCQQAHPHPPQALHPIDAIKMMAELTLAKEKFEERTAKLSSPQPYRQPAHSNVHIPLHLYDRKQDFSNFWAISNLRVVDGGPKGHLSPEEVKWKCPIHGSDSDRSYL